MEPTKAPPRPIQPPLKGGQAPPVWIFGLVGVVVVLLLLSVLVSQG